MVKAKINRAVAKRLKWKYPPNYPQDLLPDYSGSWDAVKAVIDFVVDNGGSFRLENKADSEYKQDRKQGVWHCDIWTNKGMGCQNGETPAMAICKAFLGVIGIK